MAELHVTPCPPIFQPREPLTWLTAHASSRMTRRSVRPEDLQDALTFGRWLHADGMEFVFLGQRDVPAERRREFAARHLAGLLLVMAGGMLVTVYKNQQALRSLRRRLTRLGPRR